MDEFIEKFTAFRKFLNDPMQEKLFFDSGGSACVAGLKIVKREFENLGLNDVF